MTMEISVIFSDGAPGMVESTELEELIRKKLIFSFRRGDGWVVIGVDPVRASDGERRLSPVSVEETTTGYHSG